MANEYYEQKSIWGNGIHFYQEQVLETILHVIPEDVETILDIGCGDGYITNALNKKYQVTGMDISAEALGYVEGDTVLGNITEIPLKNGQYDLVMTNDVLEHIAEEDFFKALKELCRVAKKYIIVTVPHEEDVEDKSILCANCGEKFHINLHQRAFNKNKMLSLFREYGISAKTLVYTGDMGTNPYNPVVDYKRALNVDYYWEGAVCPYCGEKVKKKVICEQKDILRKEEEDGEKPQDQDLDNGEDTQRFGKRKKHKICKEEYEKLYYALRQEFWKDQRDTGRNNRSEILCLYTKKKLLELKVQKEDLYSYSVLNVHFANQLQQVDEICEGQEWTRWQIVSGLDYDGRKVRRLTNADVGYGVLYYPYINIEDSILIKGDGLLNSEDKEKVAVSLFAIDAITGASVELEYEVTEKRELRFFLPSCWNASRFGYKLDFYLYAEAVVNEIIYETGQKRDAGFWNVNGGYQMIELGRERETFLRHKLFKIRNEVQLLESFQTDRAGAIPVIVSVHAEEKAAAADIYRKLSELLLRCKAFLQ